MTNDYVNAGDGYHWYIVEKTKELPPDQRYNDLSRDSEYEAIATEDGLGVPMGVVPMTEEELETVKNLPHVSRVYLGGHMSIQGQKAGLVAPDGDPTNWGLELHQADRLWSASFLGAGAKVAVVDTGISYDRVSGKFRDRVEATYNFVTGGENVNDQVVGHGTFVAGEIGASDYEHGAAPSCLLYIAKSLGDDGFGSYSSIINGMNWAASKGVHLVNMSIGGPSSWDNPINRAVTALRAKGIVVVVAAGNEQGGASTYMADKTSPANSPDAITVGAIDRNLRHAYFSNVGNCLDIAAAGVAVPGLGIKAGAEEVWDGTSMATPHVTGIAAQLVEAGYTGEALRTLLLSGALDTAMSAVAEGNGVLKGMRAYNRR